MRVAAAVIGGLGATLGTFKGFTIVLGTFLLTVSGDDTGFNPLGLRGPAPGFDPFLVLWGSTEGGAAVSCVLGMIGAGLVIAGRLRTGAWLMLAGAVGVVASAYTYILLQPVAMGSAFEPYLSPGLLPARPWHVQALFLSRRSSSGRPWRSSPVADQEASRPPAKLAHDLAPNSSTPEGAP